MFRSAFKPGDAVPESCCYWVNHYRHRLGHAVYVGIAVFPSCNSCGDAVRFEKIPGALKASVIGDDVDFIGGNATSSRRAS